MSISFRDISFLSLNKDFLFYFEIIMNLNLENNVFIYIINVNVFFV